MPLRKLSIFIVGSAATLCAVLPKAGATVVLPTGLAPGSKYQIAFVSADTTAATSDSVGYYNNFITNEAAPLASALPAGTTFTAIASIYNGSSTVDYTSNAPTYSNIPIYNTDGQLVDPGSALFDAAQDTNAIDYTASGNLSGGVTGAQTNLVFTGIGGGPLGFPTAPAPDLVQVGLVDAVSASDPGTDFLDYSNDLGTNSDLLYGLSSPIIAVPEPRFLAAIAVPAAILLLRRRRWLSTNTSPN